MADATNDSKLKETVKAAVVEVLQERPELIRAAVQGWPRTAGSSHVSADARVHPTVKVILLWVALLVTAVLLYSILTARQLP